MTLKSRPAPNLLYRLLQDIRSPANQNHLCAGLRKTFCNPKSQTAASAGY